MTDEQARRSALLRILRYGAILAFVAAMTYLQSQNDQLARRVDVQDQQLAEQNEFISDAAAELRRLGSPVATPTTADVDDDDVPERGPRGFDGLDGRDAPCITAPGGCVGPQGPMGPEGPAGPAGEDGTDGLDGKDGADGAQGPQGDPGPVLPCDQTPSTLGYVCATTTTASTTTTTEVPSG